MFFGLLLALLSPAPAHASSGDWERAWGKNVNGGGVFGLCTVAASCQAGMIGGLGGELDGAKGIATDAAGNVYVAEYSNRRIEKFDSLGNFQRAWGKDVDTSGGTGFEVCTVAASCQAGTYGTQGGELGGPTGLATDAAGNVYVADYENNRIQKFDPSGTFLRAWGKDVDTGGGTGFEICIAAASCKAGTFGGLGGELNDPAGIAVDGAGNVYTSDQALLGGNSYRIQKFDSSGNWERAWGKDVVTGGATGFEVCTVAANCKQGATGALGGELDFPADIAADAAGNVYVADDNNNRIQKFDSSGTFLRTWGKDVDQTGSTDFEICIAAASCKAGVSGVLGGELSLPNGVAADAAGNVYVGDFLNNRIQKFDSSGSFQRAWGKDVDTGGGTGFEICTVAVSCKKGVVGELGGELNFPLSVAADGSGNVYVADSSNYRIQKFVEPAAAPPPGGGSETTTSPSNSFTIGKLNGRKLKVTVGAAGVVDVNDASAPKRKLLLRHSSATASGPDTVTVTLKLTKAAKTILKDNGKVKVKAKITFTPTGGTANTQTKALKVRK